MALNCHGDAMLKVYQNEFRLSPWRCVMLSSEKEILVLQAYIEKFAAVEEFDQPAERFARILSRVQRYCGKFQLQNSSEQHSLLTEARRQLNEYFNGKRTHFDLPYQICGTDFQKEAWNALLQIPFGATWTYTQQATFLGSPGAARAVGTANGNNLLQIFLPCHRVIGNSGSLVGYSGGLGSKVWLLQHEGILPFGFARSCS